MPAMRHTLFVSILILSHSMVANATHHIRVPHQIIQRRASTSTSTSTEQSLRTSDKTPRQLIRLVKEKIHRIFSPTKNPWLTPSNIFEYLKHPASTVQTPFTMQQIRDTCTAMRALHKKQLDQDDRWLNGITPLRDFFEKITEIPFTPYIQKKVFDNAENTGTKIISISDLHGDVQSLIALFEHFQEKNFLRLHPDGTITITNPQVLFVFTGDYVDRGKYGVETLKLVFDFYNHNPNQVVLVRGNHEDYAVNRINSFHKELIQKLHLKSECPDHIRCLQEVYSCYEVLPAAFYVGGKHSAQPSLPTQFIKFCHGACDLGSTPHALLNVDNKYDLARITSLDRLCNLHTLCCKVPSLEQTIGRPADLANRFPRHIRDIATLTSLASCQLGDVWGDIIFEDAQNSIMKESCRGALSVEYGKDLVHALCAAASSDKALLLAIVRGHQHTEHTMPIIKQHGGAYCAWRSQQHDNQDTSSLPTTSQTILLRQGDVVTVAPAPLSGYGKVYDYHYVPYGELDLATTKLTIHQVPIQLSNNA